MDDSFSIIQLSQNFEKKCLTFEANIHWKKHLDTFFGINVNKWPYTPKMECDHIIYRYIDFVLVQNRMGDNGS